MVINILEAHPAAKGLLWFPLNLPDVQFFSQLALSDCARIKITFQGRLHRLLFSDIFACLRLINFLPCLGIIVLLTSLLYMNKTVTISLILRPKNMVISVLLSLFLLQGLSCPFCFPFRLLVEYILCAEM